MAEINFDDSLFDAAKDETFDFSKDEVTNFVSGLLNMPLVKVRSWMPDDPLFQNQAVVDSIVSAIPKELWRGDKAGDGTVSSNVLSSINYQAIIETLMAENDDDALTEPYQEALSVAKNLSAAQIESGIQPGTATYVDTTSTGASSALENAGIPIGDYGGPSTVGPVTQENQQELFRLDAQRTIGDLVKDLEQKGGEYYFDLEGFALAGEGPEGPAQWDVKKTITYPWDLNEAQMKDLQSSLGQAGYYERLNTRPSQLGQIDEQTGFAWSLLLRDAIAFGKTPAEMLKHKIRARNTMSGENMLGVQRKDESEIFNIAQQTGSELLGRGLTNEELSALTEQFRVWETTIAKADWMSVDPEATTLNLQAKTEEYLRERFQGDYLTQKILGFLGNFERALR